MNLLGFVQAQPPAPADVAPSDLSLQLRLHDVLGSTQRLWLRGRLIGVPVAAHAVRPVHWWNRRREPVPPPQARVETQVSGRSLVADASVSPSGDFEVCFTVALPPTRRGWRVVRNRVIVAGQTAEACGLVLAPPPDAAGAAVILLPRTETLRTGSASLGSALVAARLAPQLERLRRDRYAIYYLACVPTTDESRQAELALAVTALGWPNGHIILVPADEGEGNAALEHALDRLRWLFSGCLELLLVNLDPEARTLLASLKEADERAPVRTMELPLDEGAPLPVRDNGMLFRPVRAGRLPRYPIVFCHGMLACTLLRMQLAKDFNYFAVMRNFLRERGFWALYPLVTPTGGVVERARQLKEQIEAWTDEPVNIVAHSMGGLDARYLITHLGMADRVKSLTTVSTPHRGSPLADWFLANYRHRVPLLLALEALGISVDGFRDCRLAECREFNARTPDAAQVRYFSYAGEVPLSRVTPMLRRGWEILTAAEGPNDGMVSVPSARWGEFLGIVPADHFAQTPDGLFIHPVESFDSLGFVMRVIEGLALRGF
jgi:triacylglycerol lipase